MTSISLFLHSRSTETAEGGVSDEVSTTRIPLSPSRPQFDAAGAARRVRGQGRGLGPRQDPRQGRGQCIRRGSTYRMSFLLHCEVFKSLFVCEKGPIRDHEKKSSDGQGVVKDRVKRSKCMRRRRRWWGAGSGNGDSTLTSKNKRRIAHKLLVFSCARSRPPQKPLACSSVSLLVAGLVQAQCSPSSKKFILFI